MTLRLNTATTSPLSLFEHDVNISASTKAEVFKFLVTILKNFSKDDAKYRQLRTMNPKIQKMISYPAVMSYLKTMGFVSVEERGETFLKCYDRPAHLEALRREVNAAQERVNAQLPAVISHSSSTASLSEGENLSEKQKARKLAEEKEAKQKLADRAARKRTVDQIKADKWTRQNDPDWKPSVSAAAEKSGDSMQIFRDKYGES
jgi:hypothetical protein